MLIIDVNLGNDIVSQIKIYEGDTVNEIAESFTKKFNLN